jgi:2,3-bisphosphoglycerate-independent phosphoglycerate mutase
MKSKAFLVILDGYGIAANPQVSAIDKAHKPTLDAIFSSNPTTQLIASGEAVGLPEGQFGNSEVGHLNIGSGRIVWQDISRINKDIREQTFFENPTLKAAFAQARLKGKIHLMGLISDGGVHSHQNHILALLDFAKKEEVTNVFIHAFTDGRDTDPKSGKGYVTEVEKHAQAIGTGEIASIIGRYYAMDRDNRWERVKRAYDLLINGIGTAYNSSNDAFEDNYASGKTDEFLEPCLLGDTVNNRIEKDDVVIFFNFRSDRARQITRSLTQSGFDSFETKGDLNLHYVCFTQYDASFKDVKIAFEPQSFENVLGKVVSDAGLKQLRIAETEKYPHVTFFFNGGEETPFLGEDRILIPSPKVATYDLQPEMSAPGVGEALSEAIKKGIYDLIILNFANPDMVGHTGDINATAKAVEAVDKELAHLIPSAIEQGYQILVIADHGNADCMINPDGSPNTAHTTQPVPCALINNASATLHQGILADVAPTLLKILGIAQPTQMTGKPLF